MLRTILVIAVVASMNIFCLNGCKDSSSEAEPGAEEIKTAAEYAEEAKKEINEANMDEELDRLEKALEQDIELE